MNNFSLSPLHSGVPPTGWLHSDWAPEPTVVLSAFALAAFYILWTGPLNRRRPGSEERQTTGKQMTCFLLGCLFYLIALSPPLDDWSDFYLLSAHMLQHEIIMFAVAPLLLVGTPAWLLQPLANNRYTNKIGWVLTRPVVAGVISTVLVVLWHLPQAYNAALRHEPIHIAQHGAFLVAGLLAWWPVLGPLPAWPKIESPPIQCLYLFLYNIPAGIIGAFITMSEPGFYDYYTNVRRIFGIDLAMDQELAGLMMWVGGSSIYLLWITWIFLSWAKKEEAADREQPPSSTPIAPAGIKGT
jgi:putative membrane protein